MVFRRKKSGLLSVGNSVKHEINYWNIAWQWFAQGFSVTVNIVILKMVSTYRKQGCTVPSIRPSTFQCMFALLMLVFGNLSQMIIMASFYVTVMCLAVVLCLIALRIRQPHARRPMKVRVRGSYCFEWKKQIILHSLSEPNLNLYFEGWGQRNNVWHAEAHYFVTDGWMDKEV